MVMLEHAPVEEDNVFNMLNDPPLQRHIGPKHSAEKRCECIILPTAVLQVDSAFAQRSVVVRCVVRGSQLARECYDRPLCPSCVPFKKGSATAAAGFLNYTVLDCTTLIPASGVEESAKAERTGRKFVASPTPLCILCILLKKGRRPRPKAQRRFYLTFVVTSPASARLTDFCVCFLQFAISTYRVITDASQKVNG